MALPPQFAKKAKAGSKGKDMKFAARGPKGAAVGKKEASPFTPFSKGGKVKC